MSKSIIQEFKNMRELNNYINKVLGYVGTNDLESTYGYSFNDIQYKENGAFWKLLRDTDSQEKYNVLVKDKKYRTLGFFEIIRKDLGEDLSQSNLVFLTKEVIKNKAS